MQENRKSSLVEELLNKAIRLYREEHFEEAIAKWEEVLALDPSKLEAKFNIEIAQDRIKEKQIQKDLEKTHIQKKDKVWGFKKPISRKIDKVWETFE